MAGVLAVEIEALTDSGYDVKAITRTQRTLEDIRVELKRAK